MALTVDLARERQANGLAVGIAPRRADVIGRLRGKPVDRDVDRLLEADDQHIAGCATLASSSSRHAENEPGIAAADFCLDAGLDRIGHGRARQAMRHDERMEKADACFALHAPVMGGSEAGFLGARE